MIRMHELSAATSMVRTIVKAAQENGARRIKSVRVQIGELTLLNPEQLSFCFDVASKDTIAQGAKLDIEKVPAEIECRNCGSHFSWEMHEDDPALHLIPPMLKCKCGTSSVRIVAGREFKVVSITVEQDEPSPCD